MSFLGRSKEGLTPLSLAAGEVPPHLSYLVYHTDGVVDGTAQETVVRLLLRAGADPATVKEKPYHSKVCLQTPCRHFGPLSSWSSEVLEHAAYERDPFDAADAANGADPPSLRKISSPVAPKTALAKKLTSKLRTVSASEAPRFKSFM